jgi:small-conductance mechanosensitive channel
MYQKLLDAVSGDLSTNQAALLGILTLVTLLAYFITLPMRRPLVRARGEEPGPGERVTWLFKTSGEGLIWPLFAAVLAGIVLAVLPGKAPLLARLQVLTAFWFLALFQVISASLRAFFPPGPGRRKLRRGIVPSVIALAILDHLGLLAPLLAWLDQPLFTIQETPISLLSFLSALLVAIGFMLGAKAVGDLLANRLLPRLGVEQALADALGAISRYLVVLAGFFVATDTLGFNLTSLKILLGALSVGIGFGLQNIVNNFVSGLILMFERTVKRGDIINVSGVTGKVLSIGLRSSVIETRAGHEIIVPNSEFVAGQVDNLSFRDPIVRLDVPVGVSYSADPNQVREILLKVASGNPSVLPDPPPDVLFGGFGESSIDFELRGWIVDVWRLPSIRSELLFGTWYALKEAGIEIPFPQRDLHIRSGVLPITRQKSETAR